MSIEIKLYIQSARITKRTKDRNSRFLKIFQKFLSQRTNTLEDEIHLEKIYIIQNFDGKVVSVLPIRASLIDEFFLCNVEQGYSWLYHARSALSSFFRYLYRQYDFENIMKFLTFKVQDYKPKGNPRKALSRHEVLKFIQCVVQHSQQFRRDLLLFTMLLSTGCRISEILNLKYEDINQDIESFLIKKSKNHKQRYVIMRIGYKKVINKFCELHNISSSDFIFQNKNGGKLSYKSVRKLLGLYLQKAKLKKITIHSLRHTFATLMYESKTSMLVIQQLLGQESITSTEYYVHPNYVRNDGFIIAENQMIYDQVKHLIKD